MKKTVVVALVSLLTALGIVGCQKDPSSGTPAPSAGPNRQALLGYWADSLVKPGYQRFNGKFGTLKTVTAAFAAAPTTATLLDARQAWQQAYLEWQKVELYEFGPAESVSLRNHFNIYPTDEIGINRNISSGTYDFEVATAIPQQGFPALDYLLNGLGATDAAIVQQYVASASHRRYLTDVVAVMDRKFSAVYGQWNGTYRDTFVGSTGTDASSSFSRVVNAYSLYFERYVRAGKVGIPAGTMTGTPRPEKIEAYYFRGSLPGQLATTAHATARQFYEGRSGQPSLKAYLSEVRSGDSGAGLAGVISTQFAASQQQLGALGPDLYATVRTRNADAVAAYNEMQKVVRLIKVDLTSALGVTVTYVDNDGD